MAIPTKEKLEEIAVFAKAHSSYFGTVQQEMVHTVAYLKVMGNTEDEIVNLVPEANHIIDAWYLWEAAIRFAGGAH